jgi:hypothetical protein
MPQMHFYVAEPIAKALRDKARRRKLPVSRYLAEVATREVKPVTEWPKGYFAKVVGSWKGQRIKRPSQGSLDEPARWAG